MLSFSLSPSTYISLQCTQVAHNRGTSPRISPARLPLSMCRKAQLRLRQLRQSSSGDAENKVDAENQVVPAWVIQCNVINKVINALKDGFFFFSMGSLNTPYIIQLLMCIAMWCSYLITAWVSPSLPQSFWCSSLKRMPYSLLYQPFMLKGSTYSLRCLMTTNLRRSFAVYLCSWALPKRLSGIVQTGTVGFDWGCVTHLTSEARQCSLWVVAF